MEGLRDELIKLISEKGPLNERTILVSQELDKLIVSYYMIRPQKLMFYPLGYWTIPNFNLLNLNIL